MGQRLHSAVKYEVKYSSTAAFNWGAEKVNPIIEVLSEYDYFNGDDGLTIEANRENLLKNVDRIITPDEYWEYQLELNELLEDLNTPDGAIDRNYLHEMLKKLIEQSDSQNNFVYFAWF